MNQSSLWNFVTDLKIIAMAVVIAALTDIGPLGSLPVPSLGNLALFSNANNEISIIAFFKIQPKRD